MTFQSRALDFRGTVPWLPWLLDQAVLAESQGSSQSNHLIIWHSGDLLLDSVRSSMPSMGSSAFSSLEMQGFCSYSFHAFRLSSYHSVRTRADSLLVCAYRWSKRGAQAESLRCFWPKEAGFAELPSVFRIRSHCRNGLYICCIFCLLPCCKM